MKYILSAHFYAQNCKRFYSRIKGPLMKYIFLSGNDPHCCCLYIILVLIIVTFYIRSCRGPFEGEIYNFKEVIFSL